ncbi:MAG: LysM domain, partial [Actinomycetota bacterium]|nr:LysM domain [Actinomycetota bacterium]
MWRKMIAVGALGGLVISGSAAGRIHTVRRGDTLEAIGRRYGVDVVSLVAANGLHDADRVVAGTALSVPGPRPAPAPATATRSAPARRAPTVGALRETVVRMPATKLAAARTAPRIVVPAER